MTNKRLNRRDFLRLSATAAAGMVVVACQAAAPPAAQSETAAGEAADPAKAPVELRFIKLSMSEQEAVYFEDSAIPKFQEANAGLTVTVDMSDWGHLGEKMLTSFAGNIPIDLVETGSDWVGPYAKRNQFMPIDDYISQDYQDEIEDFYAEMVDLSRFENKLMALPYVLDIRTMVYRKDFFEEAGLDPETPPDTWDDLVEFATKLTQVDDQGNFIRSGYLMNLGDPASAFFEYWYLLVQNGSGVIEPWGSWDTNDISFNGPEGVEALQFLYDLIHKYKVSPLTGMSSKIPNLSALAEGLTAMQNNGSSEIGNWKEYQPDKIDLLGVGVPLMKKKRLQYAVPNVYATGINTKNPDEAWLLMKHMVSQEIMTGMLGAVSASPPRKSIAADADYMQDSMLKKFQEIPEKGWGTTTPQAVDFPTLQFIGNYVQAAIRDEIGFQEALDKAAEEVAKKVEEANQAG